MKSTDMLKINSNENKLLNIVKYTPPIFILIISIIISIFLYSEYKKNVEYEKRLIEDQYINESKREIKSLINTTYQTINDIKNNSVSALKADIKNQVNNAYKIAYSIFNKYKNQKTEEEIKELIKTALRNIRHFDNRGYYFIYEMKGTNVLHPEMRSLEGKSLWNYQDAKGTYLTQDMNKILENKSETFYEWYWYKTKNSKIPYKKIGFFKKFEPYDWFIGMGEYTDDFNSRVKQDILNQILKLKFANEHYIFIIDSRDGQTLSTKYHKLIGKSVNEMDSLKDFTEQLKDLESLKNGKYIQYLLTRDITSQKDDLKISYVKLLDEWNWIIGTGFNLSSMNGIIEKKQKQLEEQYDVYLRNSIIISVLLIVTLLFVSQMMSNYIKRIFFNYKEENKQQERILYQQSKMASMGEMLANIAHQWRQPLSIISTASTGAKLQSQYGLMSKEELEENLDKINHTAQHLSQTIEDFRTYFNPKHNDLTIFNIKNTIEKTLTLINTQFTNHNIQIVKQLDDIEIESLENELIQTLINILNNSRDALVDISIEENRYIFIETSKDKNNLIIKIYDNAGGISPDIINRIFEPYFTTKHQSHGTGIGLYMTQDIVQKLLNGSISASNKKVVIKNKEFTGAQFKIILPIKKA